MMYCANNTTARKIAHSLPIFLDTYRRRRGFHSQSVSKLADVIPALLLLVTDLAGGRSSFVHYRELGNSLRSRCRRLHRSLRLWKLRRKYAKMCERSHTKSRGSVSLSLSPPLNLNLETSSPCDCARSSVVCVFVRRDLCFSSRRDRQFSYVPWHC